MFRITALQVVALLPLLASLIAVQVDARAFMVRSRRQAPPAAVVPPPAIVMPPVTATTTAAPVPVPPAVGLPTTLTLTTTFAPMPSAGSFLPPATPVLPASQTLTPVIDKLTNPLLDDALIPLPKFSPGSDYTEADRYPMMTKDAAISKVENDEKNWYSRGLLLPTPDPSLKYAPDPQSTGALGPKLSTTKL